MGGNSRKKWVRLKSAMHEKESSPHQSCQMNAKGTHTITTCNIWWHAQLQQFASRFCLLQHWGIFSHAQTTLALRKLAPMFPIEGILKSLAQQNKPGGPGGYLLYVAWSTSARTPGVADSRWAQPRDFIQFVLVLGQLVLGETKMYYIINIAI